jgi:hypothetical protein
MPLDPEAADQFSFVDDLPLTRDAIAFAQERHRCQRRIADGAPFVLHPLEVASMLARSRFPDHVVAAAVLHDVLEDTDAERSDLTARFGADVAELVELVSDDPTIAEEEQRKDEVRERVRAVGGYGLDVYAADKVSKVRELRVWISGGLERDAAATKLRRYRKSLEMLERTSSAHGRLVELLRFEIEAIEALPPELRQLAGRDADRPGVRQLAESAAPER